MHSYRTTADFDIVDALTVDPGALYAVMASIYASTENFADAFEDVYPTPAALTAELNAIAARPGGHTLIAVGPSDQPLGFIKLAPNPSARLAHTAWRTIGVVARMRGQGVARALATASLMRARWEKELLIVYLAVRADNHAAVALNQSLGFKVFARLERDFRTSDGTLHDGLLMRQFLDES